MGKKIIAVNAGPRMGCLFPRLQRALSRWAPRLNDSICSDWNDIQGVFPVLAAKKRSSKGTASAKTDWEWTLFDPAAKKLRHDTVFPKECQRAYELGAALAR